MKQRIFLLLLVGLSQLDPMSAHALISSGTGNQPVSPVGLPEGALAVANLASRAGWWEGPPFGGGEWHFIYRGDNAAFNQALTNFAAIRVPLLEMVLHSGVHEDQFIKTNADWTFTIWVPTNWNLLHTVTNAALRANDPDWGKPVPAPRVDVYLSPGGSLDWKNVTIPANVRVRDERTNGIRPSK